MTIDLLKAKVTATFRRSDAIGYEALARIPLGEARPDLRLATLKDGSNLVLVGDREGSEEVAQGLITGGRVWMDLVRAQIRHCK